MFNMPPRYVLWLGIRQALDAPRAGSTTAMIVSSKAPASTKHPLLAHQRLCATPAYSLDRDACAQIELCQAQQ
jgi:hypothetical protein